MIECELHNTPFSGLDRKKRRTGDRASLEMALAVRVMWKKKDDEDLLYVLLMRVRTTSYCPHDTTTGETNF